MTGRTAGGDGPRIGVLGHVGNRNLGDEATLAAVFRSLTTRALGISFTGITLRPGDTRQRHGVPAWPLRRGVAAEPPDPSEGGDAPDASTTDPEGDARRPALVEGAAAALKGIPGLRPVVRSVRAAARSFVSAVLEIPFIVRSFRRIRSLDALLVVGSQQVNDYVAGPWSFPYTLLKWTVLARAAGVPVAYVSVGAGPVNTRLGHLMLSGALSLASYCSFRDPGARRVGTDLGLEETESAVVPDLAFSLPLPPENGASPAAGSPDGDRRRVVGINPLPFLADFYWHRSDPEIHESYLEALAALTRRLVERGYEVLFFPTHLDVDPVTARTVIERARRRGGEELSPGGAARIHHADVDDLAGLRRTYRRMDAVVATRYHGFVLAVVENRPVLPLSYHPKFEELATMIGTGDYVVDAREASGDDIAERFRALERNRAAVTEAQSRALDRFRGELDRQYDELLALGRGPRR